jgi:hypothetical protein
MELQRIAVELRRASRKTRRARPETSATHDDAIHKEQEPHE